MLAMYKKEGALIMTPTIAAALYLVSAVLFILAIRGLSSPETAQGGNRLGIIGMVIAVATTVVSLLPTLEPVTIGLLIAGSGLWAWRRHRCLPCPTCAKMPEMPQLVAAFNALGGGGSSMLAAAAAYYAPESFALLQADGTIGVRSVIELSLSVILGAVTLTGSFVAYAKLNGNISGGPILLPARHLLNILFAVVTVGMIAWLAMNGGNQDTAFWVILGLALVLGITLIIPIGGADMPVVISMLNSYSGWAATALGFSLGNFALIVTGALVGSSGAILSYIMCKGMNRSFLSVILGGFGADDSASASAASGAPDRPVKRGSADDAAFIMKNASKVIIVPGYGMAVAQAQHALKEMGERLKAEGVEVSYAIHPVAGRMPGHMNVLLAEANVPYDEVFELNDINSSFKQADVAFVIGANDVTNPAAKHDPTSPIFGMPVLNVEEAKTVLFIKRSLATGYAGIGNDLFYQDNTMMLLDDAKKMVEDIVKSL